MFCVGLVGTGDIGRLHARALKQRADVELCVCRGRNPERADAFARESASRVYAGFDEMLADPHVHAVDICVPNDLHRAYVEKAAAAGKQILCEKPIALSMRDACAMVEASRAAGVLLMVSHPIRFWHEYGKLREMIRSGKLGRCLAITMRRMLSLLASVRGEDDWRHKPERMGGAILDLQIHDLDFLRWTFGVPDRVYCAAVPSPDGAWNHTHAIFHYASGMTAMVESSFLLQGDPLIFTAKAVCERGSLDYGLDLKQFEMHSMAGPHAGETAHTQPATLMCYRPGQEPEALACQEPDVLNAVFARELSYFVDCALGKIENTLAPVPESVDALQMALACVQSVESGKPIEMRTVSGLRG